MIGTVCNKILNASTGEASRTIEYIVRICISPPGKALAELKTATTTAGVFIYENIRRIYNCAFCQMSFCVPLFLSLFNRVPASVRAEAWLINADG